MLVFGIMAVTSGIIALISYCFVVAAGIEDDYMDELYEKMEAESDEMDIEIIEEEDIPSE